MMMKVSGSKQMITKNVIRERVQRNANGSGGQQGWMWKFWNMFVKNLVSSQKHVGRNNRRKKVVKKLKGKF